MYKRQTYGGSSWQIPFSSGTFGTSNISAYQILNTNSSLSATNKSFGSTGFYLSGSSGTVNVLATGSVGGTLYLPTFASGTDTLVSLAVSATLTNKTLTSPVLNTPVVTGPYETVGISATALSGSVAASIAIATNSVYYYTANPTATWALNITNAPTVTGQSATVAILVNNGATAYLPSNITVNTVQAGASSSALPVQGATNNNITSYYQNATAWSADASTLDVYTITVICTNGATPAYTLLLGLTKF